MADQFKWITLFQIPFVFGIVWFLSRPLSSYMAKVALKEPTKLDKIFSPLANRFYKGIGINSEVEHRWQTYALSAITLNLVGAVFLLIMQMTQSLYSTRANIGFIQAFNTAISFVTNTNWQSYTPEITLSNFVQMGGLSVQMFLSAATGMSIALALTRSFMERKTPSTLNVSKINEIKTLGNFWVDCTRMTLWVLVPLSFLLSILFMGLGMTQTVFEAIASQEAIKLLGTNGGGFFNANSAHPLECPSAFCNLVEISAMLLIVFSFPKTYGKMVNEPAQGSALLKAMVILFMTALSSAFLAQYAAMIPWGPTLEGMETHFGWIGTLFFNVTATTTGTGATTAALSSFPPLTGLEFLSNILCGGVIFGGVGSGLYLIVLYAILAIFLAGLMVGRTPEYLGKKIEPYDMKMVVLALMIPALFVLVFTALGILYAPHAVSNPGPHGLTEILYAFASTSFNNGSSFAGLKAYTPFYQLTTSLTMIIGRFVVIVAVLALAGNLAQKPKIPATTATFPTTGPLFIGLLIAVILMTSILIFFPIFSLGPLAEQVSSWPLIPSL
ncbi:MAG: potassium-transporting ATPase subunit A [Alphaproteobacteria bacterium]|nr:potassium-transporting ATPase subunit A [Alphaproteobacteria bacterium]